MSFSERVYNVVCRIPKGKVSTYGAVARALDCKAYRAVGAALAKNPYAPRVPCHRVIKSDCSLGGFMGCSDNTKKRVLLEQEGVIFEDGLVAKECVITLST